MAFVECCLSNVSSEARVALDESNHEVREAFCLDRCGRCHERPFLVVDGALRDGQAFEGLLRDIDGAGVEE